MPDNELELKAKAGLPEFHGFALAVEGRFKRTWASRRERFMDQVQNSAGLELAEVADRIEHDEALGDLFVRAVDRVCVVADEPYRDALARLVGAAMDRSTKVHETDALTNQLLQLEPVQLRVFIQMFGGLELDRPTEDQLNAFWRQTRARRVAEELDVSHGLAAGAMAALQSEGLLDRLPEGAHDHDTPRSDADGFPPDWLPVFRPTMWGIEAFRLLFPGFYGMDGPAGEPLPPG